MKQEANTIFEELKALANEEKRTVLSRFFKTAEGQYGAGDRFLGITVPLVRTVAKAHRNADHETIGQLIASPWHEVRLCGLLILTLQADALDRLTGKGDAATAVLRKALFDFYLSHTDRINNWDLVDLSAPTVVGRYLTNKPRDILYRLAESPLLWDNRIAMVATYALIRDGQTEDTYRLALKLMHHPHDLMHKAVGWMLREAGKRDMQRLYTFIDEHRSDMPRTTLRYAIERFDVNTRQELMQPREIKKTHLKEASLHTTDQENHD